MNRTLTLRRLAASTAPVLLVVALTACGGGDSDVPDDASKEDFCALTDFEPDLPDDIAELSEDEQVDAVADALDQLEEQARDTGTPEDIPDDAREGFELTLDQVGDISDDELRDALTNDEDPFEGEFSGEEQDKIDAYDEWSDEYCA